MNFVQYNTHDRIAFITLDRPEKRNALSHEMVAELKSAFAKAEADASVKVIILKANGEAFCAGADLAYLQKLQQFSYDENLADSNHLKELFLQIYRLSKVVIAQVHGHALAGGCGLASVCDFSFAAPEAEFGYSEVRIGFVPAIVMVFLLRKIGEGNARRLLLTGEVIPARSAQALGLITEVVEKNQLESHVASFAERLISMNSADAMRLTKQMIADIQSMDLETALTFAAEKNAEARATDDCKRGITSFLRKQEIRW